MATNKTTFNEQPVADFIEALDNPQQKADSLALIELMEAVSGEKATMFGPNIIAFGKYAYTYASGHSGEAPLLAFSPRKNALSLYVYTGLEAHQSFLEGLGKYKMGKACIYVKNLTDIDLDVLQRLMQHTLDFVSQTYTRVRP